MKNFIYNKILLTIVTIIGFIDLSFANKDKYATFIFQKNSDTVSGVTKGAGREYNSTKISINDITLLKQNKKYSIKINSIGLDTIKIDSPQKELITVITKLREGEEYLIRFNVCSFLEITPVKPARNHYMLLRVIAKNNNQEKLFFDSGFCFPDMDELQKKDTTSYYINHYSAFCPYSMSSIFICTKEPNDKDYSDINICRKIVIHFFESEKYSLIYDYKSRSMEIKFDGYYKKDEKLNVVIDR